MWHAKSGPISSHELSLAVHSEITECHKCLRQSVKIQKTSYTMKFSPNYTNKTRKIPSHCGAHLSVLLVSFVSARRG